MAEKRLSHRQSTNITGSGGINVTNPDNFTFDIDGSGIGGAGLTDVIWLPSSSAIGTNGTITLPGVGGDTAKLAFIQLFYSYNIFGPLPPMVWWQQHYQPFGGGAQVDTDFFLNSTYIGPGEAEAREWYQSYSVGVGSGNRIVGTVLSNMNISVTAEFLGYIKQ